MDFDRIAALRKKKTHSDKLIITKKKIRKKKNKIKKNVFWIFVGDFLCTV